MSPRPTVLARLAASGGRSDRLRITLTAVGAMGTTMMLLTAAAVAFIDRSGGDGPYRLAVLDQSGLRPGVIVVLIMLCVPLAVFMGLCTRVGAPARDRRLAMFRMAGATPGEVTRIAAFETGLAAILGSVVGVIGYFIGRGLLDGTSPGNFTFTERDGSSRTVFGESRLLPTDVYIPIAAVVAVVAVVGFGAMFASVAALRTARISPFGVTRTWPLQPPSTLAAALFLGGAGGLILLGVIERNLVLPLPPFVIVSMLLFVICLAGLLMGTASLAAAVGRMIAPRTSRPDLLIASRRMIDAPYTASRASASVLLAVLLGSAILGTRANFLASQDPNDTFYADTFDLLNIVLLIAILLSAANLLITASESIVERRRTLALLVAGGTPKRVLARAALMESLVPLVPTVAVASAAGLLASRSYWGTSVERPATFDGNGSNETITIDVPIPWEQLATLVASTIVACILITAISLTFLRRSTRPSEFRAAA